MKDNAINQKQRTLKITAANKETDLNLKNKEFIKDSFKYAREGNNISTTKKLKSTKN